LAAEGAENNERSKQCLPVPVLNSKKKILPVS